MNMDYLYKVNNGNYVVKIYERNIRIRESNDDILKPELPEIYNFVINNYNIHGLLQNCDFNRFDFLKDILLFSEINIYGYDILNHNDLLSFLKLLKSKKCYVKLHINQKDFNIQSKLKLKELYDLNLIKEVHINIIGINKFLINNLENFYFCNIFSHILSFDKLCKLKNNNIIMNTIDNKYLLKASSIYKKKNIGKHINYLLNNFKHIEFDNNSVNQFKLNKYLPNIDGYILNFNIFFSMVFDLVNSSYYKSFNSNTKLLIKDDLKFMFNNIKNI